MLNRNFQIFIKHPIQFYLRKKFFEETSYVPLEGLRLGRFSFKGFNPEVEALMRARSGIGPPSRNADIKEDVTKQEMASFHQTMGTKFANKPQGQHKQTVEEPPRWKREESKPRGGGILYTRGAHLQGNPNNSWDNSRGGYSRGSDRGNWRGGGRGFNQRGRGFRKPSYD